MQKIKDLAFNFRQKYAYEPDEKVMQLIDQVNHVSGIVLPIKLLDQLSQCSFEMEHYEVLIPTLLRRLTHFNTNAKDIMKNLTIVDYLLKYGCSGCIDDFKDCIDLFKTYAAYMSDTKDNNLNSLIRDKSNHIYQLLNNRQLLYKEKHLAKEIKQKISMNRWRFESIQGTNLAAEQDPNKPKMEDFAENYIFKYLDRFNDKIDVWGDQINAKIDKLIDQLGFVDGLPDINSASDEEYIFPESCMEETDISESGSKQSDLSFTANKVNPNGKINLGPVRPPPEQEDLIQFSGQKKQQVTDLLSFDEEKQTREISLLD